MSGPADRLLRLMYEWMDEANECSSNLRALAQELETLRQDCNIAETVGSTAAVAGSLAVLAAPFTGGASLVVGGAVIGGLGAGVSLITKITEPFLSSGKLKRVKEIDVRCNQIAAEIQNLFQKLRKESPSSSKDERDQHVVKEFLQAMLRRSGRVRVDINVRVNSIHPMSNALVVNVLSVFSLRMEGALLAAAVAAGGKQVGKVLVAGEAMALGRASAKFLGGVVGIAFSLSEAIHNWTEAIQNNHETEASRSLRDTAQKINQAAKGLDDTLSQIEEMLQEDSESDKEEEEELKMALVNARSANKFIKRRDRALIDLIQNNDLDVLLITETWFLVDSLPNIRTILPPNYNIIHNPRYYGRGGGVAIIHRNSLACVPVPFDFASTFEVVAATVTPPGSTETVCIFCVYRPPGSSVTEFSRDFLTELCMFLIDVGRGNIRNIIIGGDFNVWVDCPDLTTTQDFLVILRDNGFIQHVSQPTHRGGHILDLVLSKPNIRITNVSIQPNAFSDHYTVLFRAKFKDTIRAMKNLSMKKHDGRKKLQRNYQQ